MEENGIGKLFDVISYVPITQIGLAVATTNRWIRFIAVTCPYLFFW